MTRLRIVALFVDPDGWCECCGAPSALISHVGVAEAAVPRVPAVGRL